MEAKWVQSESVRHVMSNITHSHLLVLCAMVLMLALLYGHVSLLYLLIWFNVSSIIGAIRFWLVKGFNQSDKNNYLAERAKFFARYAKLAPLNGFVWAISTYLFNGISSPNIAIFCLLIVLIFGAYSVTNLSSTLRVMKHFIGAYCAGLLFAVVLHIAVVKNYAPDTVQLWYLAMAIIFSYLLLRVGTRMNTAYIEGLRLQYRNRVLISSLTEQRETALAAVATKNRMLASATHDMRQPVLALDLYASWLAEDPSESATITPKIVAATKAVISMFDSMFDMSRLTEGQINTNLEAVNLSELFSALQLQHQPMAKLKQLSFRTHVVQGVIFTDYILLERILGNLLSNAIKYTETGGVLLACRNTARGIKIEVWDTGIGILHDQQSLVFNEFYKSPSNLGTAEGFGLGLSIVSQLADLIGAELTLKSRRGRGTVVAVQLGKII